MITTTLSGDLIKEVVGQQIATRKAVNAMNDRIGWDTCKESDSINAGIVTVNTMLSHAKRLIRDSHHEAAIELMTRMIKNLKDMQAAAAKIG
jgi:hypothetical protein